MLLHEAEMSSRIEGTRATVGEVLEHQAGIPFGSRKSSEILEVISYHNALFRSSELILNNEISQFFIRSMHAQLMAPTMDNAAVPGGFRERQVWIGAEGRGIEDATYVPPEPFRLAELMQNLEDFIQSNYENLDPLVKGAVIHAQFEMIHPFQDGNGRVGRMLIPLFLKKVGCLASPNFYISAYFERHRQEYYGRLNGISQANDWNGWIEFFLDAAHSQAESNLQQVKAIRSHYEQTRTITRKLLRSSHSDKLTEFLFERLVFRRNELSKLLGISSGTATRFLQVLREEGIANVVQSAAGRTSAVYDFARFLDVLDANG